MSRYDELEQQRLDKVDGLRARGVDPYPVTFDRTHPAGQLHALYATLEPGASTGARASVAGRLMLHRDSGKLVFCTLRDVSGEIQLFCALDVLGAQGLDDVKAHMILAALRWNRRGSSSDPSPPLGPSRRAPRPAGPRTPCPTVDGVEAARRVAEGDEPREQLCERLVCRRWLDGKRYDATDDTGPARARSWATAGDSRVRANARTSSSVVPGTSPCTPASVTIHGRPRPGAPRPPGTSGAARRRRPGNCPEVVRGARSRALA